MTIDEVQQAMVSGQTVRHTHGGITAEYTISGVISRYSKIRGWYYVLELKDRKADSLSVVNMEEVENDKYIELMTGEEGFERRNLNE